MVTGNPEHHVNVEGRQLATDAESVSTDEINSVQKPFNLLRQAGYNKGGVFPVFTWTPTNARSRSTTRTAYRPEPNFVRTHIRWDRFVPDESQGKILLQGSTGPGTDETYDIAIVLSSTNEPVLEVTDAPDGLADSGWVDYTPADTTSELQLDFAHRSNPGNNSSVTYDPIFAIGVEL